MLQEPEQELPVLPPSRTPRDWKTLKRPAQRLLRQGDANHYQIFLDTMHHIRNQVNSAIVREDREYRGRYTIHVPKSNPFGTQQLEEMLEKLGDWVNEILNGDEEDPDFYTYAEEQNFYEVVTNLRMLADTWNMVLGQYHRNFSYSCVNNAHSDMDEFLQFLITETRASLDFAEG